MQKWQLWSASRQICKIDDIEPVLDCWDEKTSKAKIKLEKYLNKLKQELNPLLTIDEKFFLHMDIVVSPEHYLHDHDLDNYLRPVVYTLGATHFVFVSAKKLTEGKSQLFVGIAEPNGELSDLPSWKHASIDAGKVSYQIKDWKLGIREKLRLQEQVVPGPVQVTLIWHFSSRHNRNWTHLWKPTIDSMGPLLGEPNNKNPFDPDDGRVVSLGLHLIQDDMVGWAVDIGMYWKSFPS